MKLRIITYNIHKGFDFGNRRFVLHDMREALREAQVDVAFLQEIQGEHLRHYSQIEQWPEGSQLEFLADKLWPNTAYGKNAVYQEGHHGNAIISRYPFVQWDNINVSKRSNASRSLLHGVIEPESGCRVHIICVHLGLFAGERKQQIDVLAQRIKEHVPDNEALIVAGDFNDWRKHCDAQLKESLDLKEVFEEMTGSHARSFPAFHPLLKVDRIYYRGFDVVDRYNRLDDKRWRRLSDHLPLYAQLRMQ